MADRTAALGKGRHELEDIASRGLALYIRCTFYESDPARRAGGRPGRLRWACLVQGKSYAVRSLRMWGYYQGS